MRLILTIVRHWRTSKVLGWKQRQSQDVKYELTSSSSFLLRKNPLVSMSLQLIPLRKVESGKAEGERVKVRR